MVLSIFNLAFELTPDIETFGFITKENRQRNGLSKEHYNDAVMIASGGDEVIFTL